MRFGVFRNNLPFLPSKIRGIFFILITLLLALVSCEKEPNKNVQNNSQNSISRIYLLHNSDTLLLAEYSSSSVLRFMINQDKVSEETKFYYDSTGILTKTKVLNYYKKNIIAINQFEYDNLKQIIAIHTTKFFSQKDSLYEKKTLDYKEGKLVKINAYFPVTFEYLNDNVSVLSMVESKSGWTSYHFSYDNGVNPFYNIGLPAIDILAINRNNITAKIAYWEEMQDCMMPNQPCEPYITHIDTIYVSSFEYDSNSLLPIKEYRKYRDRVDTIAYIYE